MTMGETRTVSEAPEETPIRPADRFLVFGRPTIEEPEINEIVDEGCTTHITPITLNKIDHLAPNRTDAIRRDVIPEPLE